MAGIGAAAVCGVIALTVMCGYVKGLPVFELFTKGAAEGMHTAIKLLPTLLGLIVGISMLRASGFLELFSALLRPSVLKQSMVDTPLWGASSTLGKVHNSG